MTHRADDPLPRFKGILPTAYAPFQICEHQICQAFELLAWQEASEGSTVLTQCAPLVGRKLKAISKDGDALESIPSDTRTNEPDAADPGEASIFIVR